jgi:hypothetical protein
MKKVKTIGTTIEPILFELRNNIDNLQSIYDVEKERIAQERLKIREAFKGKNLNSMAVVESYQNAMDLINDKTSELKIMIDSLTNALGVVSAEWLRIKIMEKK